MFLTRVDRRCGIAGDDCGLADGLLTTGGVEVVFLPDIRGGVASGGGNIVVTTGGATSGALLPRSLGRSSSAVNRGLTLLFRLW